MLHVDAVGLITRERQVQPVEEAVVDHVLQIVSVVEVLAAPLIAEEEPVASGMAQGAAFL